MLKRCPKWLKGELTVFGVKFSHGLAVVLSNKPELYVEPENLPGLVDIPVYLGVPGKPKHPGTPGTPGGAQDVLQPIVVDFPGPRWLARLPIRQLTLPA